MAGTPDSPKKGLPFASIDRLGPLVLSRPLLLVAVATSVLASSASAAKFTMDSSGARPRKYRLTCYAKGLDTGLTPNVYKKGLFDRIGSDIKEHPHLDFQVGEQDGQVVLVDETGWQSGEYRIVGECSDLDNCRVADGVQLKGRTEWDTGSIAWRVRSNAKDLDLPAFSGELLGYEWARDQLLTDLASGAGLSPTNREVLSSVVTQGWVWFIDANDERDVPYYEAKAQEMYLAPFQAAMASADDAGKVRLLALHEAMTEKAQYQLDYYRKDDWRPDVYVKAFEAIVGAMGQLTQGQ